MKKAFISFLLTLFVTLGAFASENISDASVNGDYDSGIGEEREAASVAIPDAPNPPRLVNDFANILSSYTIQSLERKLVDFNDSTSTQITVVTVPSLGDFSANEFATELAHKWGVGQAGKDNGVVVLVKPKRADSKGEAYIATGYGLEGALPDIVCHQIVSQVMIPRFKVEDYDGGIIAACDNIISCVKGEYTADHKQTNDWVRLVVIIILIVLLLVLRSHDNGNNNGRGHVTRGNISRGGFGGFGGGFGGGGFSGGFGGGGGGGFGGFGGGGFGGGGSGGSW